MKMVRTGVLSRYGFYILLAGIILAAVLLWLIFSSHSGSKVPSRGVFVYNPIDTLFHIYR